MVISLLEWRGPQRVLAPCHAGKTGRAMYRTSTGVRALKAAEAMLFREGLAGLTAMVEGTEDDELFGIGVRVFDVLSRGQKLAMLNTVGRALLLPGEPAPALTAVVEGTVAAVFRYITEATQAESELPNADTRPSWRRLILDAFQEHGFSDLRAVGSADMPEWELEMTCLQDLIFFDADWEGVEDYLDGDVATNRGMKELMGIADDYFVHAPLEPTDEELECILASLRALFR